MSKRYLNWWSLSLCLLRIANPFLPIFYWNWSGKNNFDSKFSFSWIMVMQQQLDPMLRANLVSHLPLLCHALWETVFFWILFMRPLSDYKLSSMILILWGKCWSLVLNYALDYFGSLLIWFLVMVFREAGQLQVLSAHHQSGGVFSWHEILYSLLQIQCLYYVLIYLFL